MSAGSSLTALVVSDFHDSLVHVHDIAELRTWLSARGIIGKIDIVLSPGDLTTAEHGEERYAPRASNVLAALATIAPVIFVPGNHDPLSYFQGQNASSASVAGVLNAHGRLLELADGLWLSGWGGSSTATDETGRAVWPGFPFADEATNAAGYAALQRPAQPIDSLVVMTHCGPAGSGTTAVSSVDPNSLSFDSPGMRAGGSIESGSSALRSHLSSRWVQKQATVSIHGHTHVGVGQSHVGRVPVVNAGSLRYGGRFALLDLQRREATGRWELSAVHLHSLDSGVSDTGDAQSESNARKASRCAAASVELLLTSAVCFTSGGSLHLAHHSVATLGLVALPWSLLLIVGLHRCRARVVESDRARHTHSSGALPTRTGAEERLLDES